MSNGIYLCNKFICFKKVTSFSLPTAQNRMVIRQGRRRTWVEFKTSEKAREILNLLFLKTDGRLKGTYRFNASIVMPIVDHPTLRHGVVEVKFDNSEERDRFAAYALEKFFPQYAPNGEKEWGVPQRLESSLVFRTSMFYRKGDMIEKLHAFLQNLEPFFEDFVLERSPYAFL